MSMDRAQAGADLAAIEDVIARVKQSRIYRIAGDIMVFWGFVLLAHYAARMAAPAAAGWSWIVIDGAGVAINVVMIARASLPKGGGVWRMLAAYALFYGFGGLWFSLAHFDGPAQAVFWHTLFLFGYSLAGLWFGLGFLVIGVALSLAILAIYLFAGAWFWLLIALTGGGGLVVCGLWMRRA